MSLSRILCEISACRMCEAKLPHGARPILRASRSARLLIISQAPGSKVHETGIPWNDASGDRHDPEVGGDFYGLPDLNRSIFYDQRRIVILPIGFCYPSAAANGGDKPPRPECAPLWHGAYLITCLAPTAFAQGDSASCGSSRSDSSSTLERGFEILRVTTISRIVHLAAAL